MGLVLRNLKHNNFDYRFINFNSVDFDLDFPILKQIDRSKIITFDDRPYVKNESSHPNKEQCIEISERIIRLPMFYNLKMIEIEYVAKQILNFQDFD